MTPAAAVITADRLLCQVAADALASHHAWLITRGVAGEEIGNSLRVYAADLAGWKSAAVLKIALRLAIAAVFRAELDKLSARIEAIEARVDDSVISPVRTLH